MRRESSLIVYGFYFWLDKQSIPIFQFLNDGRSESLVAPTLFQFLGCVDLTNSAGGLRRRLASQNRRNTGNIHYLVRSFVIEGVGSEGSQCLLSFGDDVDLGDWRFHNG